MLRRRLVAAVDDAVICGALGALLLGAAGAWAAGGTLMVLAAGPIGVARFILGPKE